MHRHLTLLTMLLISAFMLRSPAASALSEDYICASGHTQTSLQMVRWLPHEFPITVYIPPVNFKGTNSETYHSWVKASFAAWTQHLPGLRFKYVDKPEEAGMQIQWLEAFAQEDSAWGKATLPQAYADPKTRKIKHRSKILLATRAQIGTGFSALEPVLFSQQEFVAIATHEVGHALGLLHSDSDGDLMYPAIMRLTAASTWGLSQRDILTLKRIYALPRKIKQNPCPR